MRASGRPERFGERVPQSDKLVREFLCRRLRIRRRYKWTRREGMVLAKGAMKPDPELACDLERGQGLRVINPIIVSSLVSGDPNLMEEVCNLAGDDPVNLQAPEQIGLRFVSRCEYSSAGCNLLRQQFAELAQLDEASIGIVPKVALGKACQPHKLLIVPCKKAEVRVRHSSGFVAGLLR